LILCVSTSFFRSDLLPNKKMGIFVICFFMEDSIDTSVDSLERSKIKKITSALSKVVVKFEEIVTELGPLKL